MKNGPWRILLVEDDEDDYIITRSLLLSAKEGQFELHWSPNYDAGLEALGHLDPVDAILVDYDLGAHNGLDFTRAAAALGNKAPIILFTGRGSYEIDVEAMQAGASDYISKNEANPYLLERTIRYSIERKRIEEALRQAQEELEKRVEERTLELREANEELRDEIAERMRVEAELAEIHGRMTDSREDERLHLSQELHDGPIQSLIWVSYQLKDMLAKAGEQEMAARLAGLNEQVLQTNRGLRAICGELRPPTLTPFGLEKAIRSHADTFRINHPEISLDLELDTDKQALPERLRLALFRIYQQALANIVRHAGASQIWVRFKIEPGQVLLEVRDDGRGFIVPERWIDFVRQGHLGLAGSSERAEAVGGEMKVCSEPGRGTTLEVIVPRKMDVAD